MHLRHALSRNLGDSGPNFSPVLEVDSLGEMGGSLGDELSYVHLRVLEGSHVQLTLQWRGFFNYNNLKMTSLRCHGRL